jgi:hypothetical protein
MKIRISAKVATPSNPNNKKEFPKENPTKASISHIRNEIIVALDEEAFLSSISIFYMIYYFNKEKKQLPA